MFILILARAILSLTNSQHMYKEKHYCTVFRNMKDVDF